MIRITPTALGYYHWSVNTDHGAVHGVAGGYRRARLAALIARFRLRHRR